MNGAGVVGVAALVLSACGSSGANAPAATNTSGVSPASSPAAAAVTQAVGGAAKGSNLLTVSGINTTTSLVNVSSVTCFRDGQGHPTSVSVTGIMGPPETLVTLNIFPTRLEILIAPVGGPPAPGATPAPTFTFDPRPNFAVTRATDVTTARVQAEADLSKTDRPGGISGPVHVKVDAACP